MSPNVWSSHSTCSLLENSFKKVGSYINTIALSIARHCDDFVKETLGTNATFSSLEKSLKSSRAAKGRLLNYFPAGPHTSTNPTSTASDEMWCGYHNDHGTLTGLISGQFYDASTQHPISAASHPSAGLYVCRRDRTVSERISIPPECIAFQIGEAGQIATGGLLRATPHAVRMPSGNVANLSRATLAVFLQPNPWEALKLPDNLGASEKRAALQTSHLVPALLNGRYEECDTFANFSRKTFIAYCSK